jgi:hypothetical protein
VDNVLRRRAVAVAALALAGNAAAGEWWAPGDGRPLGNEAYYENAAGVLGILNTSGTIDTRGHPFFEPLGGNGRGCVTCHQPADAMSLAVTTVRERWDATGGKTRCSPPSMAAIAPTCRPANPQRTRCCSHAA